MVIGLQVIRDCQHIRQIKILPFLIFRRIILIIYDYIMQENKCSIYQSDSVTNDSDSLQYFYKLKSLTVK
jgi:hypothetical protein